MTTDVLPRFCGSQCIMCYRFRWIKDVWKTSVIETNALPPSRSATTKPSHLGIRRLRVSGAWTVSRPAVIPAATGRDYRQEQRTVDTLCPAAAAAAAARASHRQWMRTKWITVSCFDRLSANCSEKRLSVLLLLLSLPPPLLMLLSCVCVVARRSYKYAINYLCDFCTWATH